MCLLSPNVAILLHELVLYNHFAKTTLSTIGFPLRRGIFNIIFQTFRNSLEKWKLLRA